jgi:GntR family transcriptional regulator
VAGKTVTTQLDQWHSFTQEMNEQGVVFKTYEVVVHWLEADEMLRTFFNIPEGTRVLCLRRLRGSEDVPFVYFESYFHPSIGLTGQEDFSRPLYEILELDFHVIPTLSRERIKARLCTAAIAKKLHASPGEAILVRERFVYDPGERPVEYNIGYYRADKFTYSIDFRRGAGKYGEQILTTTEH